MKTFAIALLCALLADCATPAPSPGSPTPATGSTAAVIPDLATLTISNGTTLTVTVMVNDQVLALVPLDTEGTLGTPALPVLPWNVEARSSSGRLLLAMTVKQADILRDSSTAGLVDLSCGRLWLWVGDVTPDAPVPPTTGPASDCLS
jgi:hypothetical protein